MRKIGSESEQMATIRFRAPDQAISAPQAVQRVDDIKINANPATNPASAASLSCFGVIASVPGAQENDSCQKSDGSSFTFSAAAGLADIGQELRLQVSAGSEREFRVIAFSNEAGSCPDINLNTFSFNDGGLSNAYLVREFRQDVVIGDNIIQVNGTLNLQSVLSNCAFSRSVGCPRSDFQGLIPCGPLDLAGTVSTPGANIFTASGASYLVVAPDGNTAYATDTAADTVLKVDLAAGTATTIAGNGAGFADNANGLPAQFSDPQDLVLIGSSLYVNNAVNHRLRLIDVSNPNYPVSTVAGTGTAGVVDGTGTAAQFSSPRGMTLLNNSLYVAELNTDVIRKVDIKTTVVTTVVSSITGTNGPFDLTNDGSNLYLSSRSTEHRIYRIPLDTFQVISLAGATANGAVDGTGSIARFNAAQGIAINGTALYVMDQGGNDLRKIE